jgi:hypothetical protein
MTTKQKELRIVSFHPALADAKNVEDLFTLSLDMAPEANFEEQVKDFFSKLPPVLRASYDEFGPMGQSVASILCLPIMEMSGAPMKIGIWNFFGERYRACQFDLSHYRNNIVRPLRNKRPDGEAFAAGYTILNGGHPMTDEQLNVLAEKLNTAVDKIRVISVSVGQLDPNSPAIVNGNRAEKDDSGNFVNPISIEQQLVETGLTVADWESGRILYNPAPMSWAANIQASAIYALAGVWVPTIRIAMVGERPNTQFLLAEVVYPQTLRQFGVEIGQKWRDADAPAMVDKVTVALAAATAYDTGMGYLGDELMKAFSAPEEAAKLLAGQTWDEHLGWKNRSEKAWLSCLK